MEQVKLQIEGIIAFLNKKYPDYKWDNLALTVKNDKGKWVYTITVYLWYKADGSPARVSSLPSSYESKVSFEAAFNKMKRVYSLFLNELAKIEQEFSEDDDTD